MKELTREDFKRWGSQGGKKHSPEHMRKIAKLPRKLKVKSEINNDSKIQINKK